MPRQMPEKRSAYRVPVQLPACYRSPAVTIEGMITDLSRLGMFRVHLLIRPSAAPVQPAAAEIRQSSVSLDGVP